MRKLLSFWPSGWPEFPIIIILALFVVLACATFNKPEKTIVLNLAAQNCGFLLAKHNNVWAEEMLVVCQAALHIGIDHFTKANFHDWTGVLMQRLELDPFLQMNFTEMLKLVNIEITLAEDQQEIVLLTFAVIQNFTKGIQVGLTSA